MDNEKYNVDITHRAKCMMVKHTEFLARVSQKAARKLTADLKKMEEELSEDPYRFPFADDLDAPGIPPKTYRKNLFYGRYKALFLIEGNNVFVDAIIDSRQENKDLF